MRKYKFTANGKKTIAFKTPEGRKEVSYEQWMKAYEFLKMSQEAKKDFEEGYYSKAQKNALHSICHTICALSEGIEFDDLIKIDWKKINNLFIMDFEWLSYEEPKKEFKINGRYFQIPRFIEESAGAFMDAIDLIKALEDGENDAEIGLLLASIYLQENGEYTQDIDKINEKKEFFKKHAKMDLLYSCAFFFKSFLNNVKIPTPLPMQVEEELEKLTSSLNGWAITLYSQASLKVDF